MEAHTRYLELRLAQCRARPELHAHQIEALEALRDAARASADGSDYVRRTGNLFALTRAEWLDRYVNLERLADLFGDDRAARAARLQHEAAAPAADQGELLARISEAKLAAAPVELAAQTSASTVHKLILALWQWATDIDPTTRDVRRATVAALWRTLQTFDPGCGWERVCEHPPYRDQLPFDRDGLAALGEWLRDCVGTQLVTVDAPPFDLGGTPPPPPPDAAAADEAAQPSVADAARIFRDTYAAAEGDPHLATVRAVCERVFELQDRARDVTSFMAAVEEADLLCELARAQQIDRATRALEHCAGLAQPHVEHYYRELIATVKRCPSRIAIEYEVARLERCFAVESAWHQIALQVALRPVAAALVFEVDDSASARAAVARSCSRTEVLFGAPWEQVLRAPGVWDFFAAFFFRSAQHLLDVPARSPGVWAGEVGYGLLHQLREAALPRAIEHAQRHADAGAARAELDHLFDSDRFSDAEAMAEHVAALVARARPGADARGDRAQRSAVLWGRPLPLARLGDAALGRGRP